MKARPQGYSGQFDGIESLAVSMADLEFPEAVECARPVIEFDRTRQQAQEALAALQSAKSSPAVVNLMRTPLQSHIMAIVVRDGHQPPERRWKLFDNFYEVIRKREAAKKIEDKILFRLLSNEDKLLKTIHNRTGFVVHARAEKGVGALTNISREVFDGIVREAAGDLVSQNAVSVAARVSKAATERLVLVNTPDSGSTIRFDIRQLQEFFSGEFIYDSVGLESVITRLRLVAGDAHWREVVYFAISAFIETNRSDSAWASAVILADLDVEHERGWGRTLARAMARGAHIALHLAEEGVFEQDRRVRAHFSKALQGCVSGCFGAGLENIRFKKDSDTLRWLVEEMLASLRKSQGIEEFGAMLILMCFVPDDWSEANTAHDLIARAKSDITDGLFEIRFGSLGREIPVQRWVARMASGHLSRRPVAAIGSYWPHYFINPGISAFEASIDSLKGEKEPLAYQFVLKIREVHGLKILTDGALDILSESSSDWLGEMFSEFIQADRHFTRGSSLDILATVFRFAAFRKASDLTELIDIEGEHGAVMVMATSQPVSSLLTSRRLLSRLRRTKRSGALRLPERVGNAFLIGEYRSCFISRHEQQFTGSDISDWIDFCEDDTFWCVRVILLDKALWTEAAQRAKVGALWNVLKREPVRLTRFLPFLAELEVIFGSVVRDLVLQLPPYSGRVEYIRRETKLDEALFSVDAVREKRLLPALAARGIELLERDPTMKANAQLREALRAAVSKWNQMPALIERPGEEPIIRFSALVITLMGSNGADFEEDWIRSKIVEFYDSDVDSFYIEFVCSWARSMPAAKIDLVARTIAELLESPRLTVAHRCELDAVVQYLRETSFAPVTSSEAEAIWLADCKGSC